MSHNRNITDLLNDENLSQMELMEQLFPLVYRELHRIAHNQLGNYRPSQTICTTSLISETWLKLARGQKSHIVNRAHFFAVAAKAMRQIVINDAQQRRALKRGGHWQRVTFDEMVSQPEHHIETLLSVNDALEEVRLVASDLAELVEMRFFSGMTEPEIAEVLGVSDRTIRRNWLKAKALISQALTRGAD